MKNRISYKQKYIVKDLRNGRTIANGEILDICLELDISKSTISKSMKNNNGIFHFGRYKIERINK